MTPQHGEPGGDAGSAAAAARMGARMRAIADVASGVLSCRSCDELERLIRDACRGIMPYDAFTFATYHADREVLRFLGGWDGQIYVSGAEYAVAGTPSEGVIATRRPLLTLRSDDPAAAGATMFGQERRSESIIRVPILGDERVLGVMSVQSYTPTAYDDADVEVMVVFAAVAAAALQNIQLLERHGVVQDELRASEEKFRTVVEQLGEGIVITDLDERIVYTNHRNCEITGYTRDELVGRIASDVLTVPEDRERIRGQHAKRVGGGSSSYQVQQVRGDGSRIWVEIHGQPLRDPAGEPYGTVGVIRDITERRLAEEELQRRTTALQESESRFRQVVQNIREVFWLSERPSGRLLYVSPGYEEVWGRSVQSLMDDPSAWLAAVHPEDVPGVRAALQLQPRGEYDVEFRVVRPDGSIRWVRDRAFPVREEDGSVTRVAGIAEDITEIRARDMQLRRAEGLAVMGTLIGGVAHELNNPLQAIRGFAELLLDSTPDAADREALETISREARRAARIVSELRSLARNVSEEPGPRQPVDLNDVVRHVLRTREYSMASANIEVTQDLSNALPSILADASQVEQVVLNLVVNAVQALESVDGPRRLILRTRCTPDGCSLHVYDNGPGIEPGLMPRLFDPFFTTKAAGDGTGLGLAIVHQIITAHGGTVHVESEPGRGSKFMVQVPLGITGDSSAVSDKRTAAPTALAAMPEAQLRILIVDDEESLRRMLIRIGTRRGHIVDTAAEGGAALELIEAAQAAGRPYDLVLSDLHMPGVSGRELTQRLLAADGSWEDRLILLTGAVESVDIAWLRERTRVPIMHKPFSLADMNGVLASAEERALAGA